jgi:23S rRNA G2445 N2-methylase RlmL
MVVGWGVVGWGVVGWGVVGAGSVFSYSMKRPSGWCHIGPGAVWRCKGAGLARGGGGKNNIQFKKKGRNLNSMTTSSSDRLRAHYQQLRLLSCDQLWTREVPRFDAAPAPERMQQVAVVRAVGVVFSETGSPAQKQQARHWLRGLLADPAEKVRRYAMAALPKLGAGEAEEHELLALVGRATSEREDRALVQTLSRIGGKATLELGAGEQGGRLAVSVQQVKANVARREGAGALALDAPLKKLEGIRVALQCRSGLTPFVVEELNQASALKDVFRIGRQDAERIELVPEKVFSLNNLYALRCFSALVFPLGDLPLRDGVDSGLDPRALAALIASGPARHIMQSFTEGTVRYRLEFFARRTSATVANEIAEHVFAAAPALLNDPRQALWEVSIRETAQGVRVELSPRLRPDPRFAYRRGDVPAASHPPLAAAMARLAGVGTFGTEKIWDPFCGSGLELAECALRGEGGAVFGTDLSAEAVAVAKLNFASANRERKPVRARFVASDFREAFRHSELSDLNELSLVICNPPLGKRVPVNDLRSMVRALFGFAGRLLRPGGRLVFVNPVELRPEGGELKLDFRQKVDVGFAHLHLEKWVKQEARGGRPSGR